MKITDNYKLFTILLLDLNLQIGLSDIDKFNELSKCFDITEEAFMIENNKLKRISYELNMDMFDKEDRIRDYTPDQFDKLILKMITTDF